MANGINPTFQINIEKEQSSSKMPKLMPIWIKVEI